MYDLLDNGLRSRGRKPTKPSALAISALLHGPTRHQRCGRDRRPTAVQDHCKRTVDEKHCVSLLTFGLLRTETFYERRMESDRARTLGKRKKRLSGNAHPPRPAAWIEPYSPTNSIRRCCPTKNLGTPERPFPGPLVCPTSGDGIHATS